MFLEAAKLLGVSRATAYRKSPSMKFKDRSDAVANLGTTNSTRRTPRRTLKAILSAPGSRGDVNPMIAIGRNLKRLGYDVVISVAAPYAQLAEEAGLPWSR